MRLAVVIGCLAAAALTLLFAWPPGADPCAWLVWGREVTHLDLATTGGPSWKPLTGAGTTVLPRPESWPFLGLFAIWLWIGRPEERRLVVALLVALPVLWYVPDWIGAGDPLYGGRRARSGGTVGIDLGIQGDAARRALASVAL